MAALRKAEGAGRNGGAAPHNFNEYRQTN